MDPEDVWIHTSFFCDQKTCDRWKRSQGLGIRSPPSTVAKWKVVIGGEQPQLGDLLTMVINHLLNGMILQVGIPPLQKMSWNPFLVTLFFFRIWRGVLADICAGIALLDPYWSRQMPLLNQQEFLQLPRNFGLQEGVGNPMGVSKTLQGWILQACIWWYLWIVCKPFDFLRVGS